MASMIVSCGCESCYEVCLFFAETIDSQGITGLWRDVLPRDATHSTTILKTNPSPGEKNMRLTWKFMAGLAVVLSLASLSQRTSSAQEAPPIPPPEISVAPEAAVPQSLEPQALTPVPATQNYGSDGATLSDCASGNCNAAGTSAGRLRGVSGTRLATLPGAGTLGTGQAAQLAKQAARKPITPAVGAGDCDYRQYGPHDLFRQYYVPNNCGGPAAELYPAPHYVPPHVGHVYYTYQPLYPHEFLYNHHRTYHRYYDDGRGLTRTSVRWW
jgi:hypothetical protein